MRYLPIIIILPAVDGGPLVWRCREEYWQKEKKLSDELLCKGSTATCILFTAKTKQSCVV